MDAKDWVILSSTVVAVIALIIAIFALRAVRRSAKTPVPDDTEVNVADQYAFVINPSKQGADQMREQILDYFNRFDLPEPSFFETTEDDPGYGQTKQAVAQGATVVVAAGGDGTVRAVATELANTKIPMGLLPLGTGNLLARNIDIDVTNTQRALDTITTRVERTIDIGRLRIDQAPADPDAAQIGSEHVFLVIGGIGFDAAMIAATSAQMKKRVGWLAYFMGGIKHMHTARSNVTIDLDGIKKFHTTLRTLLIGNCGRLPAGLSLIPDAVIDDGRLDIATVDTRGGIAGWFQLLNEVILQGFGFRPSGSWRIGRIDHTTARRVTAELTQGSQQVQVDGDVLGLAQALTAWVEPAALRVRAPISQ